jgi:4-hydroxymandelate oxidase
MSVRLFGDTFPHPLLLAPTGYHLMVHPEGEVGVARGASAAGAGLVVSTTATTPVEDVAKAATTPWWFQLYVQPDRGFTRDLLDRVAALGGRAVCLTVDTPVLGARNREQRAGFKLPPGLTTPMNPVANAARREALSSRKREPWRRVAVTWRDVEWLLANTKLPILLKGVLHPADAERAVGLGVAGLMVSNHGGRNLDTALATIDALPAIVERVGQKVPVLVDGGIRRGTDALKALARGARAVLVGRPYLYGLAVGGAAGVTRVMEILRTELEMAMMLAGAPSLAAIDPSIVEAPPCGK